MSLVKAFATATVAAVAIALSTSACGSPSPPVKGKVIDTIYRAPTFGEGGEWHASVELADGTVLGLDTHADNGLLSTKVHIGDCVLLKTGNDTNIGNADNIVVYRNKKDCFS